MGSLVRASARSTNNPAPLVVLAVRFRGLVFVAVRFCGRNLRIERSTVKEVACLMGFGV
jgi:hypothetical protein